MKTSIPLLWLALGVAGLCCLACPTDGDGCAAVRRPGDYVRIAEENAVIVWDAPSKTQHFIRRATFDTQAADFGFLVPTPTQPKLAEVPDDVFDSLARAIRPRLVTTSGGFKFGLLLPSFCGFLNTMPMGGYESAAAVRVLDAQRVGGLDAVVLEADDAQALTDWLKERGYPTDPELVSWLGPYVSGRWKITAFKIAPGARGAPGAKANGAVRSAAVRMSFQTEQPFFPYREPRAKDDKPADHTPRMLRVFFVGDGRTAGKRGPADWAARVPWADRLDDPQRAWLANDLGVPAEHIPAGTWLTTFEDHAAPRPATDEVYFERSTQQSAVRPPDIVERDAPIWIPVDVMALVVLVVGFVVVQIRRSRVGARKTPGDSDFA